MKPFGRYFEVQHRPRPLVELSWYCIEFSWGVPNPDDQAGPDPRRDASVFRLRAEILLEPVDAIEVPAQLVGLPYVLAWRDVTDQVLVIECGELTFRRHDSEISALFSDYRSTQKVDIAVTVYDDVGVACHPSKQCPIQAKHRRE
jgi:hypothetical protein